MVLWNTGDYRKIVLFTAAAMFVTVLSLQPVTANAYLEGGDEIRLTIGDTEQYGLTIHNPTDREQVFSIELTSQMTDGELAVHISQAIASDEDHITVASGENVTLPVSYTAAHCTENICEGSVTVNVRSLRTTLRYTDTIDVSIHRPEVLRAAPGIELLQVLVITVLAPLVYLLSRKRIQHGRER